MIYAPSYQGKRDVLITGSRIAAVAEHIDAPTGERLEVVDLEGRWLLPGLIDSHIHIAGAGGEGGPTTRTGELSLEQIIRGGITTVIGCLGADGVTRRVESVLMKAKALRLQGISAWMYTGSYQIPAPTITGSVSRDIALIDEVIGAGEIALADHRGSFPSLREFIEVIQQAKMGGLIGGKAGIVNIHLGDFGDPFSLIHEAAAVGGIFYNQFLPTHCNRSQRVFSAALEYGPKGFVDLTTGSFPYYQDIEVKPSDAFFRLLAADTPPEHITMSSDAGGSLPHFDENGKYLGMKQGDTVSLLREVLDIIAEDEKMASQAIQTVTLNPATILKLPRKGRVEPGYDADLLALNGQKTDMEQLWANGVRLI